MQGEPSLQTVLRFFPTKNPFQPKRVSLTEEGNTQDTPTKVKIISHNALMSSQWIPHPLDKNNIYLLRPMMPPKQKRLLLDAHKISK